MICRLRRSQAFWQDPLKLLGPAVLIVSRQRAKLIVEHLCYSHDIDSDVSGLLDPLHILLPFLPGLTCRLWPLQTADGALSFKTDHHPNFPTSFTQHAQWHIYAATQNSFTLPTTAPYTTIPHRHPCQLVGIRTDTIPSLSRRDTVAGASKAAIGRYLVASI